MKVYGDISLKIGNVHKYCHADTPRYSQSVLRNTKALLMRTM